VITLIVSGYLGDRYGQRILTSIGFLVIAMVGMILIIAVPASHPQGRLAGYYLTQASPAPFVAILSLISSNVAGMDPFTNPNFLKG
jgi:MFS transporter, ACS family, allantoate permease